MTLLELEAKIKSLYDVFFEDMQIDKQTGIIEGTEKRFSGHPYIGINYLNAPVKVLFISLVINIVAIISRTIIIKLTIESFMLI